MELGPYLEFLQAGKLLGSSFACVEPRWSRVFSIRLYQQVHTVTQPSFANHVPYSPTLTMLGLPDLVVRSMRWSIGIVMEM